jgi:DNA-binding CsgD family transcriptional regulator/tetratricopeptide (TPR) repeat protein
MTTDLAIAHRRPSSTRLLRLLASASPNAASDHAALIERADEFAALDRAVGRLVNGIGGVVVIEAPAGLGKTALLEHAAELAAADGCLVRRAAPGPHERDFPFGAVRTLLEAPLHNASDHDRARLLDGPAAPAGAWLLGGPPASPDNTLKVAHGVLWLCAGIAARRPLALIVDDAQWCDRASIEVLSYLARRIEDLPLLIMVGARAGDPRAATDLLSLLGGVTAATVLRPQPLTLRGATRLIRRRAPDTPIGVCREIQIAGGGEPWLLGELAGQVRANGRAAIEERGVGTRPVMPSTRAVVRRRLAELTAGGRAVAAALAVLGPGAPPHAIAEVAGIAVGELAAARHALSAGGLLGGDGEDFAHHLIAAAIIEELGPTERERLHRESAHALKKLGAPADVVAGHLLRFGPQADPGISELLQGAALDAAQRGAPKLAASYLERALSERAPSDDRGSMLAELATVAFDAGLRGSRRHLREAVREARDGATRVDALTRLAALAVAQGDASGLLRLLEQELAAQPGLHARMAIEAAALDALMANPDRHAERAWRGAAVDLTTTTDPLLRRVGIAHRALLAIELGTSSASASAAMALEALEGGLLLREAWRRSAYHLCARALVLTDHVEEAREAIGALGDEAMNRGSVRLRAAAALYASELALRTGQVTEAECHATLALELGDEDVNAFTGGAIRVLVWALAERGAFEAARDLLAARGFDRELGHKPWEIGVLHARARLSLAEGEFERSHAEACDAGARRDAQGRPNPTWGGWRSTAALALAPLGRREEAVALADAELALAERFGAPVPIARALLARAVAEPDDAARVALCERALAGFGGQTAGLESVRLALELGSTLARMGRRVEARAALRPALADADVLGAMPLAERARRELVATGLRPRRAALEGACALTPRQRQICELAVAGKGNRAIAQQLFLSIKTVETHLAVAFRKLGVTTRMELAAALEC